MLYPLDSRRPTPSTETSLRCQICPQPPSRLARPSLLSLLSIFTLLTLVVTAYCTDILMLIGRIVSLQIPALMFLTLEHSLRADYSITNWRTTHRPPYSASEFDSFHRSSVGGQEIVVHLWSTSRPRSLPSCRLLLPRPLPLLQGAFSLPPLLLASPIMPLTAL